MRLSDIANIFRGDEDKITILAVMPESIDRIALAGIATRANWSLRVAASCESGLADLKHHPAAVIVCDRDLKLCEWRDALLAFSSESPASRIILASPENDDRLWLEVIERGGYDVLTRPFNEHRVVQTVRRAAAQVTK